MRFINSGNDISLSNITLLIVNLIKVKINQIHNWCFCVVVNFVLSATQREYESDVLETRVCRVVGKIRLWSLSVCD